MSERPAALSWLFGRGRASSPEPVTADADGRQDRGRCPVTPPMASARRRDADLLGSASPYRSRRLRPYHPSTSVGLGPALELPAGRPAQLSGPPSRRSRARSVDDPPDRHPGERPGAAAAPSPGADRPPPSPSPRRTSPRRRRPKRSRRRRRSRGRPRPDPPPSRADGRSRTTTPKNRPTAAEPGPVRVLVTGGAGYIGSQTVRLLDARGHELVVLDTLERGHPAAVDGAPLVVGDVGDGALVESTLRSTRIEAVIHFAALKSVEASFADPAGYFATNVGGRRAPPGDGRSGRAGGWSSRRRAPSTGRRPTCRSGDEPAPTGEPVRRDQAARRADAALVRRRRHPDRLPALLQRRRRRRRRPERRGLDGRPEPRPGRHPGRPRPRPAVRILGSDYPTPDGTAIRDYVHVPDLAEAHLRALEALGRRPGRARPSTSGPAGLVGPPGDRGGRRGQRAGPSRRSRRRAGPATRPRSGRTPAAPRRSSAGAPATVWTTSSRVRGAGTRPIRTATGRVGDRRRVAERLSGPSRRADARGRVIRPAGARAADALRVAYVMSRFPKLTETFILFEMLAVERQGAEIWLFPLLREREATIHPEAAPFVARAHFQPFLVGPILASQWHFLRRPPRRYLGALAAMLRGTWRSPNFLLGGLGIFPKAAHAARLMERDGVQPRPLPLREPPGPGRLPHPPPGRDPVHLHGPRLRPPRRPDDARPEGRRGRVHGDHLGRQPGGLRARVRRPVAEPRGHPLRRRHERLPPDPAGDGRATDRCRSCPSGRSTRSRARPTSIEACRLLAAEGVPFRCRFIGDGPDRARSSARSPPPGWPTESSSSGTGPGPRSPRCSARAMSSSRRACRPEAASARGSRSC